MLRVSDMNYNMHKKGKHWKKNDDLPQKVCQRDLFSLFNPSVKSLKNKTSETKLATINDQSKPKASISLKIS